MLPLFYQPTAHPLLNQTLWPLLCSLAGTLPPLPLSLEAFLANDNLLEGGLPESLFASEELRLLRVARNRLSGTLSHSGCRLSLGAQEGVMWCVLRRYL